MLSSSKVIRNKLLDRQEIPYRHSAQIKASLLNATSGKNLPAFLQHLAAFGGQMRIPRTLTCSVWYRLRCGILQHTAASNNAVQHTAAYCRILPHTAVFNNAVQHTAVFNNAVQLIAHFALNAQLIYNALLAHSVHNALLTHSVHNALLAHFIYLTYFK